jgi:hypothetical protein
MPEGGAGRYTPYSSPPRGLANRLEKIVQAKNIPLTRYIDILCAAWSVAFHGALDLRQIFSARPMLGYADYRGPIAGLYLCGSGGHPGGGVTGAPGRRVPFAPRSMAVRPRLAPRTCAHKRPRRDSKHRERRGAPARAPRRSGFAARRSRAPPVAVWSAP